MADVTRYAGPDSGRQFSEHFELDIAKAVAGDPENNLLLRDGDVITIAQRPGWDDRGASVTIGGEVTHPGTYGIKPGERLSAVLVRAGYFFQQRIRRPLYLNAPTCASFKKKPSKS